MESRILYKTSEHLSNKVEWVWLDNTEWLYCGLSNDFKEALVNFHLKEHFSNTSLYFILTRTGSYELAFEEALPKIKNLITLHRFSIWDTTFTKVMEFNSIGIFRIGTSTANTSFPKCQPSAIFQL